MSAFMFKTRLCVISILLFIFLYMGNYGITQSYTVLPNGEANSEYYLNDNQEEDSNSYDKGIRAVNPYDFPVDWFELAFKNHTTAEVFEASMLSIIDNDTIQNFNIYDDINPLNRSKLLSITEQLINASYGFLYIKRYEFLNEDELRNFLKSISYYPHYFKNTYYKHNILYDINYDDRKDFNHCADILGLDGIETAKLTLSNYPLPFKFISENINDNNTKPVFLSGFNTQKSLTQKYEYDKNIISINYYLIDDFDIIPFRQLVFKYPEEEFLLGENVLIHINNNTYKIWIEFPEGIIARSENLDS